MKTLTRRIVLAFALVAALVPTHASSQEADGNQLVVVLNARNPTRQVTLAQLKNLMLGNVAFWHGVVPVKLFVRTPTSPAGQAFFEKLGTPASRFNEQWTAKQLAGQGIAPTVLGTPEQVIAEVSKVPGAVGIMLQSEAWSVKAQGVNFIPLSN